MAKPKIILLDLDNTLWDFDANAQIALTELFHRHSLQLKSTYSASHFVNSYQIINKEFWKLYEQGKVDKEELRTRRFINTFIEMGIPEAEQPGNIWQEYLELCPYQTELIPNALAFVRFCRTLAGVGLVTNGFETTQNVKIEQTGIKEHIQFMVTSETIGHPKPSIHIFAHALELASCSPDEAIYIGDTWNTDVVGGIGAGIKTFWFNRDAETLPDDQLRESHLFAGAATTLLDLQQLLAKEFQR